MTDKSERRNAAIKAINLRDEKARQLMAEKEKRRLEEKERLQNLLTTWAETTSGLITQTVKDVNRDLSNHQSIFLFVVMPTSTSNISAGLQPLFFGLKNSTSNQSEATLEFRMNSTEGLVSAHSNIAKAVLPGPIPLEQVTADWIDEVVDAMLTSLVKTPKGIT